MNQLLNLAQRHTYEPSDPQPPTWVWSEEKPEGRSLTKRWSSEAMVPLRNTSPRKGGAAKEDDQRNWKRGAVMSMRKKGNK